jgi:hypothetical protein
MKMKRFARVSPTAAIAFDLYVVTAVHRAAKILFPKQINIRPNHEQIDFRPELISSLSRLNVEPSRNSQCTIELRAQQNPLQCNGLALWTAACAAPCTAPFQNFATALWTAACAAPGTTLMPDFATGIGCWSLPEKPEKTSSNPK